MSTVDITNAEGAIVISIEELRRGRIARTGECRHRCVTGDAMEVELVCRDCGLRINPVVWILDMAQDWAAVHRTYQAARNERARLEMRRRATCPACSTVFSLSGGSDAERRRRETQECIYREALKAISVLIPEAAARYAAEMARKALAARPTGGDEGSGT